MSAPLALSITSITAGPYNPTTGPVVNTTASNGTQPIARPGNYVQIWNPAIAVAVQDPAVSNDGSFVPVTTLVPPSWDMNFTLPLVVTATITGTPMGWVDLTAAVLYGHLVSPNGTDVKVIRSESFTLTSATAPQVVILQAFRMNLGNPVLSPTNPNFQFYVPYRASGDWTWTLEQLNAPLAAIPASMVGSTRLELNFVVQPATAVRNAVDPLNPANAILHSQPDFAGSYPVPVLRYAFCSIFDPTLNTPGVSRSQATVAYAQNIVRNVWALGQAGHLQFQCKYATSGYGMGPFGGTFDLQALVAQLSNAGTRYANGWDLAAILQLGCSVGLTVTGAEILDSIWIVQYPYGYIRDGQLFGRTQAADCNNPLFLADGWNGNAHVQNLYDKTRTAFITQSWLEVSLDLGAGVGRYILDASHAVPSTRPMPESGQLQRAAYLQAHQDDKYQYQGEDFFNYSAGYNQIPVALPSNANDWTPGSVGGNCYSNMGVRNARIGVFGTNLNIPTGATPRRFISTVQQIDKYFPYYGPASLTFSGTAEIPTAAESPLGRYSNAALDRNTLVALIDPTLQAKCLYSSIVPYLDQTVQNLVVQFQAPGEPTDLAPDGAMVNGDSRGTVTPSLSAAAPAPVVSLSITCYGTDADAFAALGPLPSSKTATEASIGDASSASGGAIAFVRGNVSVLLQPANDSSEAAVDTVGMAQRIDQHIRAALTDAVGVRRGRPQLARPAPRKVRKGDGFAVHVVGAGPGTVAASVSDPLAVTCTGPSDGEGRIAFVAFEESTVIVTLLQPHPETLMPGVTRFVVVVS